MLHCLAPRAMAAPMRAHCGRALKKSNHESNGVYTSVCWIRDVFWLESLGPGTNGCWDAITEHISNPEVAPFGFLICE